MLASAPAYHLKNFSTMDLGVYFPYFCMTCGLEKLGLHQNGLERDLSALLLRTLAVSRRKQSESIEVALDMK